jgi:hypothetical protein
MFHFIYGMSSFPLTNSIIFQDGYCTTNQIVYGKMYTSTWKMDWNHQPGTYVYFLDLQNSIAPRRKKIRHLQAVLKNCSKKVDEKYLWSNLFPIYAPCMVYLPTFGWFLGQMLVIFHTWSIWVWNFCWCPTQKTLPRHQRWRANIRIPMQLTVGKSSNVKLSLGFSSHSNPICHGAAWFTNMCPCPKSPSFVDF